MKNLLTAILATVVAAVSIQAKGPRKNTKPHVILMMADDLAYADLACYGNKALKTPVLDQMAKEGIRLTSYYSGNTVCTPSRMALLTGAYPPRLGWQGGVVGYKIKGQNGLAPEALTIAETFKEAGYRTALVGKWHLGNTPALQPMKQGFDEAYYIKMSNNQTDELWREDKLLEKPFENRLLSEKFANEAVTFIKKNKDKPFFLYLPWTAPHFPAQSHPEWKGKSKHSAFGDVVEELDARVGEVLQAVKDNKLDDNTLVIFTSDNGTDGSQKKWGNRKPYRGMKWMTLEGGNRVPCIVRWPGVIPPEQTSGAIVGAIDLFPTIAAACNVEIKSKGIPKIDGLNCWPTLINSAKAHPRNDLLFFHGWGTMQAIRLGNHKLYVDKTKEIQGSQKGPVLYDLSIDPAESIDLAAKHPEIVAKLLTMAETKLTDVNANVINMGGPKPPNPKDNHGAWLKK